MKPKRYTVILGQNKNNNIMKRGAKRLIPRSRRLTTMPIKRNKMLRVPDALLVSSLLHLKSLCPTLMLPNLLVNRRRKIARIIGMNLGLTPTMTRVTLLDLMMMINLILHLTIIS